MVLDFAGEVAEDLAGRFSGRENAPGRVGFRGAFHRRHRAVRIPAGDPGGGEGQLTPSDLADRVRTGAEAFYAKKEAEYGADAIRYLERMFLLSTVDGLWKDHLLSMDHLKEGIGLRGYAQKDPLKEYQREGFDLFSDLISRIKEESLKRLFLVKVQREEEGSRNEGTGGRPAPGPGHPLPRGHQERREDHAEAPGRQDRPERPLPLRVGEEIQEMLRPRGVGVRG